MIIIGILIFFARIIDVSLDVIRVKELIRGNKATVSAIAFLEVIIYTLGASQAFKYVSDPIVLLFYAAGYAAGNYVGMQIDNKLSKDSLFVLIIAEHDEWLLADTLRENKFGVTTAKGYGMNGVEKVQLKVIVKRKRFGELTKLVNNFDNSAYIVTMDVKDIKK